MQKFIIGYGRREQVDMIDALDLDAAQMEATRRSMADGLLDDDLADTTFAQPYDADTAREYGLTDERRSAPWWS